MTMASFFGHLINSILGFPRGREYPPFFQRFGLSPAIRRLRERRRDPNEHALRIEWLEPRELLSWTVMIYMDGDDASVSRLAQYIPLNFKKMADVGSTADVKIVAQIDSIGQSGVFGGEKGARRGLINQYDTPSKSWGAKMGNVDSGNPQSVINFFDWATRFYPADHYAMIFWDHGGGIGGVCQDDTSKSILSMMDVTQVMNAIGHIDVLAFDACLMGMVEAAQQFRNEADVMVASEEVVPGTGYDYSFLAGLVADPAMTAQTLGANIVKAYSAYYKAARNEGTTLAAIDLNRLGNSTTGLTGTIETFSDAILTKGTQTDWIALASAFSQAFKYNNLPKTPPFPGHDLVQVMTTLRNTGGVSTQIVAAADAVIGAVGSCVLENYAGTRVTGNGLSIFSPTTGDDDMWGYYTSDLSFVNDTQWLQVADLNGPRHTAGVALVANPSVARRVDLFVYGTDADDTFDFEQIAGGKVRMITSMSGWSKTYAPPHGKFIGLVYVHGFAGNDTITFDESMTRGAFVFGGKGNDRITTRDGDDTIFCGPGIDVVDSGNGNDAIAGGDGNDTLYGRGGNDRINGGEGNDYIAAGAGNDTVYGAGGADRAWGEAGNDALIGGAGNDQLRESSGTNRILAGLGDDRLYGGNARDLIYGSSGNDVLAGGAGIDWLAGGIGANLIIGGAGADQVRGRGGNNILIGGTASFDYNDTALMALMAEWTRTLPRATRIAHLAGTLAGGLNGTTYLRKDNPGQTVFNDGAANAILGNSLLDWILAFPNDRLCPPA